jgi:hypothetical protein
MGVPVSVDFSDFSQKIQIGNTDIKGFRYQNIFISFLDFKVL